MRPARGLDCATRTGGGLFSFALAHGCIECKRGEHPKWRIETKDLAKLRELATEERIRFTAARVYAHSIPKPRAPKKPTPQKNLELFPGAE